MLPLALPLFAMLQSPAFTLASIFTLEIGCWRVPECEAARWLLAEGLAN